MNYPNKICIEESILTDVWLCNFSCEIGDERAKRKRLYERNVKLGLKFQNRLRQIDGCGKRTRLRNNCESILPPEL